MKKTEFSKKPKFIKIVETIKIQPNAINEYPMIVSFNFLSFIFEPFFSESEFSDFEELGFRNWKSPEGLEGVSSL